MFDQIDRRSSFAITGVTIGFVRSSHVVVSVLAEEILRMVCASFATDVQSAAISCYRSFSLGQGLRAKTYDAHTRQIHPSTDNSSPSLERAFNTVPGGHRLHLGVA